MKIFLIFLNLLSFSLLYSLLLLLIFFHSLELSDYFSCPFHFISNLILNFQTFILLFWIIQLFSTFIFLANLPKLLNFFHFLLDFLVIEIFCFLIDDFRVLIFLITYFVLLKMNLSYKTYIQRLLLLLLQYAILQAPYCKHYI